MKPPRLLFALAVAAFVAASQIVHAEAPPALAFLRSTDVAEGVRGLQTDSVEYHPASGAGPTVWLVGVAHMGTADYFKALQQRLDAQTVVLYEGIGIHDVKKGPGAVKDTGGVQVALANALGLKFQLDAIDYRRPSFVNSDLHVPELEEEVKKRDPATKGGGSDAAFNQLLDALQGTGMTGGILTQAIGFLGASPQMRETTKLMLIEVLGRAGEMMDMAKNVSADMKDLFGVILTERNAVVMRDLSAQIARLKPGQSVAVFYGAAHMDEIAQRLRDELHYVPGQPQWDTAFSASSKDSGINPAQISMMLDLMRTQLQPGKPGQ